jgi:subtilase family serine protease
VLLAGLVNGQAPLRARITKNIDESNLVTISGNVHPLVAAANSSEAADEGMPMEHMILFLKGDAGQEAQLEQLIAAQNDPKSSHYHQYLSATDYAAQFGLAQSDLKTISNWLQDHGFTVEEIPAGGRSIIFSGNAGQVAGAFNTEIRKYSINGATHVANAGDPQIPAALADTVGGIVKLHDFRHGHSITAPKPVSAAELAHPQFTTGGSHYLAPADYGTLYDINPLYSASINGAGQTIAVLARSDIYMSDVQAFRSNFGLKTNDPVFVHTNSAPGVLQGDSTETTLDTEWSGAVAPGATIKVIISSSTSTSDGIDLAALYAVNNNVAPIITLSYGSCEAGMGSSELAFYNNLWKQAAAQGQTVMVSAGDSGAAGCDYGSSAVYGQNINGLCSSVYSTCVGGTEFVEGSNPGQYWLPGNNTTYGSAVSYIPETVWNESGTVSGGSGLWAGGGGVSQVYAKPSWQAGPGVPADGKRDVPDVSLTAAGHDGYLIWLSGELNSVGGTSAAAPSFAGMMALVDQKMNSRQGVIMPTLYPLATKQASGGAAVFHDTTMGNNSVPGQAGFSATTGYDRASGLGSVDANLLVNHWTDASGTSAGITLTASSSSVSVVAGKSGQTTITSSAVSVNAAVAMTVSGMPAGITATFASASIATPGSGSDVLTISAASTVTPGTYPLTVKAAGGSQSATLAISVVVPTPSFTLSPTSASLTVAAGSSSPVTVSAAPANGFNATLTLTAAGMPSGVTATFSPATISGTTGGSSVVTFAAASTAAAGSYVIHVTAAGGGLTQTSSVSLTVTGPASFTFAESATAVSAPVGGSASLGITTVPQNGFKSTITLSLAGVPSGVTPAFAAATTVGGSTLTLKASSTAKAGTSNITLTAAGGGVTKTVSFTLTIAAQPVCSLVANPMSVSLTAGQSANVAVSCAVTQGTFTSPLTLSLSGAPSGMTAQAASSMMAGSTSTLSIATAVSTAAGHYGLPLTASGNGYTQTTTVWVTVAGADTFGFTGSANALTVNSGSAAQMSVTSLHYGVFSSAVILSVSGVPSGVTAVLSKPAMSAPGDGTSSVSFTAASSAKSGTYPVIITATGGGVTQTVPVSLTVATGPNFTLSVNTASITIPQGGSGSIITSTGNYTGGFNGQMVSTFTGLQPGMNYGVTGANASNNMVNITIAFSIPSTMAAGTYPITVVDTGNSGSAVTGNGVTKTATFNIVVTKK